MNPEYAVLPRELHAAPPFIAEPDSAEWTKRRCDLLKLQLQGHELDAPASAGELFGRVEVIIADVSWIRISETP